MWNFRPGSVAVGISITSWRFDGLGRNLTATLQPIMLSCCERWVRRLPRRLSSTGIRYCYVLKLGRAVLVLSWTRSHQLYKPITMDRISTQWFVEAELEWPLSWKETSSWFVQLTMRLSSPLNLSAKVSLGWSSRWVSCWGWQKSMVKGNVPDVAMRVGQSASIDRVVS